MKKIIIAPPAISEPDRLRTPEECAEFLCVSKKTILKLTRQKKLACVRLNDRVLRYHIPTILAAQS